jgi:hypothetical protein
MGAAAAPASAIEPDDCAWGEIQAACRYCAHEADRGLHGWDHCKANEPGYSAKICLFWNATRCEASV